ncbi:hypothetical protein K0M31_011508, partial [Melipona bicolor]
MAGYCTREMRESAGRGAPVKRRILDGVKKRGKKTFDIGLGEFDGSITPSIKFRPS